MQNRLIYLFTSWAYTNKPQTLAALKEYPTET